MFDVSANGVKNLRRTFKELSRIDGLDVALHEIALRIRSQAIENLNDGLAADPESRQLADSIKVRKGNEPSSVLVGTELNYGHFVEFGTHRKNAMPWLEPAIRVHLPFIKRHLYKVIGDAIRKTRREIRK